ncbi:RIP metalloprotease RseP [Jeotgalibaca sp. MA1X17-3]|uniref:RIP metalloprotease RseP n=1 Tax=Jeotgalibaca sp. MA1X17-3 TaxID=2908211 RepID=UPI001F3977BC|nr:RIP metalloprotease RseP [Jeotgalibaca sp. MA1X17-3]UJF16676.1 RIP metalloprotease RseP [Jeotgalibaca sp. MA1X17-3]
MQTIITFIIIFSILVIIHEFGHFYFAKKAGILVREFAIGMGPKIFSTHKNGTTYTIRILPIGGYVRMAGYGDEDVDLKPGMPVKITVDDDNQVTKINLSDHQQLNAVPLELISSDIEKEMFLVGTTPGKSEPVRYSVKRDAIIVETDGTEIQVAPIEVQFQSASLGKRMMTNFAGPMNNYILGIIVFSLLAFFQGGVVLDDNLLGDIQPNSPAELAGLQKGDTIVAVDDTDISTWQELVKTIQENPNEELIFSVQKEDDVKMVAVTPKSQTDESGNTYGLIGVAAPVDTSFLGKLTYGFKETWFIATSIFGLIFSMFTSGFEIDAFGGPVAIYAATEEVVSYGALSVLSFLGFLSVNLGTVNLLPIPALDGGKLLLNVIEGIRGKPLEPEKEGIITVIGVGLLLILMVLVTWNDIQRFFFGG